MSLRVLIVDDEAPARRKLRRMLAESGGVEVVGEAEDGPAGVQAILALKPDLVLLDIRMPGLDGFGVVAEVGPARMPPVVFVTAYDDFAVQAFEVQALDYLLKPATAERLRVVLDRARQRVGKDKTASELASRLDALLARLPSSTPFLQRLLVERHGRAQLVPVDQVDRIEAARNYVHLHVRGARLPLRQTLGALAALRRLGHRSGNRFLVFQTLPHTLNLPPTIWRVLSKCHEARNLAEYEGAFQIDERLVTDLIAAAAAVLAALRSAAPGTET